MEVRRRVTQNEYENELEAVKTAVKEEYEKQKEAKEAKMSRSSSVAERSPEDIAK